MEPEEYFTDKQLALFSVNYKKYPVLWCSWHPKYANLSDRSRAYRRLAVAQAVSGGAGVMRRIERLCQYFHQRVKQEVARAAGGAGAEPPPWAATAEKYLCLKPFATQPPPERRLARLARGMRRGARAGAGLGTRAAAQLAPALCLPAAVTVKLWRDLRHAALDAVHKHILRGDAPGECAPSALHWAVADLSVLYGGEVTADEHYQKVETLQALLGTFHLVQQHVLEPLTRTHADAWTRAARLYSRKGAAASALLLQRRWFELRESTRRRLAPGGPPALPLHRAVADRYPEVVSGAAVSWEQLRREGRLARPTSATGPAPGETFCLGLEDAESDDSASEEEANDDDVILIEREIETIDVDGDDSADEGPAARARVLAVARGLPDLDVHELPDLDVHELPDTPEHAADPGHGRPPTASRHTPGAGTAGGKQVDRTAAGASELQDHDVNQDRGATADVEKRTDKTGDGNKQTDTTIGDCALTIANIINQTAACSKTNTDSGSKNIDAAVNTSNKVRDNVEVSKGNNKESTVSKYSDKTIDDSKEIVDVDKTIDHNLLEALQELDADFVETVILFESDEDDAKVKTDPNDEQISDNVVTEKFKECLETSSVGPVEKESKKVHKVTRLSGPKSKRAQLRNRITFESDEEGVNTKAQDASDSGQLDGASDSRVNYQDQDTNSSEINLICSENLDSDKDENLNERRPSVISRKRRLSESSESEEGLLVIADIADDVSDNSKDRPEADNERDEVDVVGVSDEDTATSGSPSVVRYPLLVELLKSKSDDLKRYKRFEEIKRRVKMEAKKLLKQRCEEMELDAIATKVVRESLAQSNSRLQEYAQSIVAELTAGGADDADDEPDAFDEKLLMIPVVTLTRIPLPPAALGRSFLSLASNRRLLARCRPCRVSVARCDRPARVAKRVRLPDIDAVRALNRTIATAQVAPISAANQAAEGAGAEAGAGAGAGASAGPSQAKSCLHSEREFSPGCGACAARALAAPAGSRAAAELQRRALRRTARLARYQQAMADRQHAKKPRKEVEHLPAPAHPPRARSPYDPQRALRDWLREKSVVAEKFGIKPRSYKKKPAAGDPIVTMNKAGELSPTPPLLLNSVSRPRARAAAAHYVLDPEGAVLSAVDRPRPARLALVADSAATFSTVRNSDHGARRLRTAFTLNPATRGRSPNRPTTEIVVTQTSSGQVAKMTPKLFNVNCVANINKTLNTLATPEPAPPAPEGEGLLPVITHVESLALSPPRPFSASGQTTITPIPRPTSQNIAQQGTSGNTQGDASSANSSRGSLILSGGFLTAQGGYIIQRPQTEAQQRSSVIRAQSAFETSASSQPAGNSAAGAQAVLLASQPAPALQPRPAAQRQANVLQVNSVQAGPPRTNSLVLAPQSPQGAGLTMTLLNQALVKPGALTVTKATSLLAPPNPVPSVLNTKQMSMAPGQERQVALFNATLQANGAQPAGNGGQAVPARTDSILMSSLNKAALPPRPAQPPAQIDSGRRLTFEKLEPAVPAVPARLWAAGRDPTALSVLGAGAGAAWRVAGQLVLCEAAAPRAAEHYYSLAPLRRLILPDDEDKMKLDVKKQKDKLAQESAKPDKEPDPSVSWLKVKSFAKMGNDIAQGGGEPRGEAGGEGEDTDSAEEAELMLRAPPRVYLENKVYLKMSETPLTYAKVLHDVSGPAACRVLLLRREPVYMYSPRSYALTPVYGEPSADGASITLTAAKELFDVLHELATYLAPPGGPAPLHKRPAPPAPPSLPAPPAPPAPPKPPAAPCDAATNRYCKVLKYMDYTPMFAGTRSLIKDKSKKSLERGEGRAKASRAREGQPAGQCVRIAPKPEPVIDLDSSEED